MTDRERVIVSAYTGYLMCDFGDLHKYIEEKLGRPVWTHELAFQQVNDEIHEAAKPDFLALCSSSDAKEPHNAGSELVCHSVCCLWRRADQQLG